MGEGYGKGRGLGRRPEDSREKSGENVTRLGHILLREAGDLDRGVERVAVGGWHRRCVDCVKHRIRREGGPDRVFTEDEAVGLEVDGFDTIGHVQKPQDGDDPLTGAVIVTIRVRLQPGDHRPDVDAAPFLLAVDRQAGDTREVFDERLRRRPECDYGDEETGRVDGRQGRQFLNGLRTEGTISTFGVGLDIVIFARCVDRETVDGLHRGYGKEGGYGISDAE